MKLDEAVVENQNLKNEYSGLIQKIKLIFNIKILIQYKSIKDLRTKKKRIFAPVTTIRARIQIIITVLNITTNENSFIVAIKISSIK